MNYIGIDIGSTCAKTVVLNEKKEIIQEFVQPTGWSSVDTAEEIHQKLELAGINLSDDSSCCVATGYGRISVPYADKTVTEITCHARGAHYLDPSVRTVVDIGGQDSKVIRLDEQGNVVNFVMNDKCAAGTGRFLEMMARTMEMSLDQLGNCGIQYKEDITISSMCTVFAESEVISHLAEGNKIPDIVAGIHNSCAQRTAGLARRLGVTEPVGMSGGVAQNAGVVHALERELDVLISVPEDCQFAGAIGAALKAYRKAKRNA